MTESQMKAVHDFADKAMNAMFAAVLGDRPGDVFPEEQFRFDTYVEGMVALMVEVAGHNTDWDSEEEPSTEELCFAGDPIDNEDDRQARYEQRMVDYLRPEDGQ